MRINANNEEETLFECVWYTRISMKHTDLEEIKQKAIPVLKQAGVTKAAIFGSYVRGDNNKESDIDVLVDLPDHATLIDLVGIKQDLEELLHKKVDIITYNGICPMLKDSILDSQYPIL